MRQAKGEDTDRPEELGLAATQRALRSAAQRTAVLLRGVRDPNIRAAGLEWTIAETAAHLVATLDHYTGWVTGERDPAIYLEVSRHAGSTSERSAIVGARLLAEFPERDIHGLAEMLVPRVERFIAESQGRDSDVAVMTWTGIAMTIPTMTAAMLGEELLHGLDIARSVRAPWTISRHDAIRVIEGVVAMLPAYLDKDKAAGVHVAYELRLRGGPRYRIAIDDGTAIVATPGERVDCWISADPVAFLLVGYGRSGQWSQTLRGKIVVGGRKPWLGLRFGDYTSGP